MSTDSKLGLTEKQVRTRLKGSDHTWEEFMDWMRGQTVALDSTGKARYYRWDVERFLWRGGPRAVVED